MSLLFPPDFLDLQPVSLLIRYHGFYRHSTPGQTVHQVTVLMLELGDTVPVTNF